MAKDYKTVLENASDEFVEKRSRFIGYCKPVKTEQEAIDFINEKRSEHWNATHNVYAYSLREGNIKRYSDDGEPSGTAGMPVLDVIVKMKFLMSWLWLHDISAVYSLVRAVLCVRTLTVQKSQSRRQSL